MNLFLIAIKYIIIPNDSTKIGHVWGREVNKIMLKKMSTLKNNNIGDFQ